MFVKLKNFKIKSKIYLILVICSSFLLYTPFAFASNELSFSEASSLRDVQDFEEVTANISKSQRWVAQVTNYDKNKKIVTFGRYAYDSGTVRRVFFVKDRGDFVLISDGKISCERILSPKFGDSLSADLKAEWLCYNSGNAEAVRLLKSFNPRDVMGVLTLASSNKVRFSVTSSDSLTSKKLVVVPSKASNVKTSKLVFVSANAFSINSKFFVAGKLRSFSSISPSSDKEFVTNLNDLKKVWK